MKKTFEIKKEPTSWLFVGNPGSGKTSLVLKHFPKVYVLDCDNNLRPAVDFTGITDFAYDVANVDDEGKMIDDTDHKPKAKSRYDYLIERLNAAVADPEIETILVDTMGTLSDILISKVKRDAMRQDSDGMRIQDWGDFAYLSKRVTTILKSSGKHIVFNAHNAMDKDPADDRYKMFLYYPGSSKLQLPGLFANVILLYTDITGPPNAPKESRMCRSAAGDKNDFRGLKNSIGLPPICKLEDLEKKLQTIFKP